jgi:hypothetical protein
VTAGLQRTGGILTAAALLLIIVVGGFATGGAATIKMLGVGTVVAVAVDAALVRTLLVPATMRLLGRLNWWAPGPLARVYRRYGLRNRPRPALSPRPANSSAPDGPPTGRFREAITARDRSTSAPPATPAASRRASLRPPLLTKTFVAGSGRCCDKVFSQR